MEPLRQRHPDWQMAYTHFSPSAETLARTLGVDVADYLPYDVRREVTGVLDSLSPSAIVFVKHDLWPELATMAAARGIPVGLVAGTVSPVSGRTAWPWRSLTRPGYEAVTAAGAIAEQDAGRLIQLGVPAHRITVTGDPRFDSVLRMVRTPNEQDPAEAWRTGGPALVAGSTWPADERVVLEAFVRVRTAVPEARLILAPHEPTAAHLAGVRLLAQSLGLPSPRSSSEGAAPGPLVLVDRLGILARLYGAGAMAYVGGGFGRAGLHSVLEPAAWGIPVVHGPRWQSSREAGLLQAAGGGFSLPATDAAARLSEWWISWLADDARRRNAGARARAVVEEGSGAAERSAQLVEQLIDD
jgi:3-deoxy-D-manno-octulosonic-acid transferase